jgi:hypothetical protein
MPAPPEGRAGRPAVSTVRSRHAVAVTVAVARVRDALAAQLRVLGRDLLADYEGPVGEHQGRRLAADALALALGGGR